MTVTKDTFAVMKGLEVLSIFSNEEDAYEYAKANEKVFRRKLTIIPISQVLCPTVCLEKK